MRIVADASAILAVVLGEAEKPRLIELTRNATVVAPPSIDWEIGNAISALLKRARLNADQAMEAVEV